VGYKDDEHAVLKMSEEQLSAFLATLKANAELQEKLKGAADLDAAAAIAKEAGFDVRHADWLRYQAKQTAELSDDELEKVAGGGMEGTFCIAGGLVGTIFSLGYAIGKKVG
jgi:predicted ribosomally synthesized peptide with nif11-like leader